MSFDTKDFENKMQKTLDSLKMNLNTVRAGKANPDVLSRVMVDYWGTPTPVAQMAAIQVPDPRTLVITPWDAISALPLRATERSSVLHFPSLPRSAARS